MINRKLELHPKAKEISFKHLFIIQDIFGKSILGSVGIDYFSLNIVDPKGTITTYSSCPAYEYRLIKNNLWGLGGILDPANHQNDAFVFWDELYPKNLKSVLIQEREKNEEFLFGFYIMRQVGNLFVIYSFGTTTNNDKERYKDSKLILAEIGDHFLSELKEVYQQYTSPSPLPLNKGRKLQLVVDNT
jgi:hypothetical protein